MLKPRVRVGLGFLLALSGCTVGPDFKEPPWYSPVSWFGGGHRAPIAERSVAVAEPLDPRWWSLFEDPELTSLEERVARGNLDVRVATIQLAESRAQRGITAASLYPSINANASYEREKASNRGIFSAFGSGGASGAGGATQANGTGFGAGGVPASGQIPPFDLYQYGFDASWELDLWGRVRRSIEAADATIDSSAEARRNTLLSTPAEVARDYTQLRGVQQQIEIANQNVKVQQDTVQLTQQRAAGGLGQRARRGERHGAAPRDAGAASAARATGGATDQRAQPAARPAAERAAWGARSTPPGAAGTARVPVGVPSELARRRPDIRQAEAQLHTATADVGVAVADFYLRVTLSGSLGIQALQPKNLFTWDARQYGLGPSVTLPIFQGGQLRATLELRKAQQQEAAVNYERTVLNAWHEVDNALTAYDTEQQRRASLTQSVEENQRALGLAQIRYRQGLIDFLTVLDAQRSLLQTEQQLADSTATVSNNLVALYKALGGGWEGTFPATTADADGHAF